MAKRHDTRGHDLGVDIVLRSGDIMKPVCFIPWIETDSSGLETAALAKRIADFLNESSQ